MSTNIRGLESFQSQDAIKFIEDHGLAPTISQISDRLSMLASQGIPIKKIEVTLTHDWDDELERLRVTVRFDTNLLGAYAAWKDARPTLIAAALDAEESGLLDFEFATAN